MIFNYSYSYKTNLMKKSNQPVSVIANFATDGRLIPIYFKYLGAEDSVTFKIDGIHSMKDKHDCIIFCCFINYNSIRQNINLTFNFNECTWLLGDS